MDDNGKATEEDDVKGTIGDRQTGIHWCFYTAGLAIGIL